MRYTPSQSDITAVCTAFSPRLKPPCAARPHSRYGAQQQGLNARHPPASWRRAAWDAARKSASDALRCMRARRSRCHRNRRDCRAPQSAPSSTPRPVGSSHRASRSTRGVRSRSSFVWHAHAYVVCLLPRGARLMRAARKPTRWPPPTDERRFEKRVRLYRPRAFHSRDVSVRTSS